MKDEAAAAAAGSAIRIPSVVPPAATHRPLHLAVAQPSGDSAATRALFERNLCEHANGVHRAGRTGAERPAAVTKAIRVGSSGGSCRGVQASAGPIADEERGCIVLSVCCHFLLHSSPLLCVDRLQLRPIGRSVFFFSFLSFRWRPARRCTAATSHTPSPAHTRKVHALRMVHALAVGGTRDGRSRAQCTVVPLVLCAGHPTPGGAPLASRRHSGGRLQRLSRGWAPPPSAH